MADMNNVYIDISTEINGKKIEKEFIIKKEDFASVYSKHRFVESIANRDIIPFLKELLEESVEKK